MQQIHQKYLHYTVYKVFFKHNWVKEFQISSYRGHKQIYPLLQRHVYVTTHAQCTPCRRIAA